MSETLLKILSCDCGPVWQFAKYATIGVMSTGVQTVFFYLLASTALKCLKKDDWAVRFLSLPASPAGDSVRALRFLAATAVGFAVANVFCWIMNRLFVFEAGLYAWYVEFAMFFLSSAFSAGVAMFASWALIKYAAMMTTAAVALEILFSLSFNFLFRKFVVFKG